jgi:hypothetical protein
MYHCDGCNYQSLCSECCSTCDDCDEIFCLDCFTDSYCPECDRCFCSSCFGGNNGVCRRCVDEVEERPAKRQK